MLKIGQNWGKIAKYPPQCPTKIGTPDGSGLASDLSSSYDCRSGTGIPTMISKFANSANGGLKTWFGIEILHCLLQFTVCNRA